MENLISVMNDMVTALSGIGELVALSVAGVTGVTSLELSIEMSIEMSVQSL